MRVGSMQSVVRYQTQLNDSWDLSTKYMEQADGSKLHRPSDDSVNYARYMRYQNSEAENLQYQSNVKTAVSWMKSADSTMVSMTELMKTMTEKTVNAANETNNEDNLRQIAKDFTAKIQQLASLGNTQSGDRYLFAGQSDTTLPYTISTEKYDRGLTRSLNDSQKAYFINEVDDTGNAPQMLALKDDDGNNYFLSTITGNIYTEYFALEGYKSEIAKGNTTEDGSHAVGNWPDAANKGFVSTYFDEHGVLQGANYTTTYKKSTTTTYTYDASTSEWVPTVGPTQDASYTVTGGNDKTVTVTNTIPDNPADGDTYTETVYSNGESTIINVASITTKDGATLNFSFDYVKQYIATYNGDAKHISMVKKNGSVEVTADTVNVTGQDLFGSDIFDNVRSGNQGSVYYNGDRKAVSSGVAAINDLLMVAAKMDAADFKWMSSDGITVSDTAHATMVEAQTGIAARQNIYEGMSVMLENQNEVIMGDITEISGTDVAELAVKMMEAQTLYNMMLSVGARILPQSLADYL